MSVLAAAAAGLAVSCLALGALAPNILLPAIRHPDAGALAALAPRWSLVHLELARAAGVAAAAAVLLPWGAWPLAAGAAVLPSLVLRWRLAALHDRAAARSLEIVHATHAALRSGIPLVPAMRLALSSSDALASDPFERALRAFELNVPLEEALGSAARSARDRRVSIALEAFTLLATEQLPAARAANVVASVADRLTFEQRLAQEVAARAGGLRAQIALLALLVPALSLYLVASMPGLAATLGTPLGTHVLIPAAAVFEIAGIVASRAVVRGVAR